VDRCRLIIHVVDISGSEGRDPVDDIKKINSELASYSENLATRPQIIAANKYDAADKDAVDFEAFEKFVKDELGAELVYVSAATGENINELVRLAANKLEDLPPMQYYEADFVPEVVIDDGDRTVEIRNENGVYIVEGDWLYNFMGSINFDDRESLSYFQRILKSSGLIDQLEAAGVKDGDTVSMYEFEFDFVK
jgi:GTP-binding protein